MTTQTLNQRTITKYQEFDELDLFTLRVTALEYLQQANQKEEYETMEEIIKYAQEFGAGDNEIYQILDVH